MASATTVYTGTICLSCLEMPKILASGASSGMYSYRLQEGATASMCARRHSSSVPSVDAMLMIACRYKKRGAGGPAKIVLSPVELLNDKDGPLPFMWIDLNFPVRAIYLPLQYQPSKDYPDLCSYLMLDFRLRKGVKMFDQKDYSMDGLPTRHDVPFDNKLGLGYRPRQTLGIDIRGVYNFLILPRQLRSAEKGLFMPTDPADALVRLTGPENPSVPSQAQPDRGFIQLPFTDKLDIAHVINEHFGVELTYIPFEMPPDAETPMEEVRSILKMAVGVGLGFIPGVGPLVQRGFMIVMAIAEDPEGFKNRDPLELGLSIADAVAESALQLRGNMSYIGKGSAKGQRKGIVSEIGLKTINFSSKTLLKDEPEIGADPKDEKEKPTIRTGLTVG